MKTRRKEFIQTFSAGIAMGAFPVQGNEGSGLLRKKPLNVIYMVVHDLGRHFGPYGVPVATPNLQRFADGGIMLDNACCGAPPCTPSRGCAMTGQYAHTNGLAGLTSHGWSYGEGCKTIVDYLNRAGYETAWAGFQHEREESAENNYQVSLPHREGGRDVFVENAVDDAIAYLEQRDPSLPFYLNIGTQEVHASLWAPGAYYTKKYDRPKHVYGIDKLADAHIPAHCPDNHQSRVMFSRFAPCIRHMDRHFGRLMDAVKRLGLEEDTLVVFTTDHGIMGSRAKGTAYERGMEIGTLIQLPGVIHPGDRMKGVVNNIDFLPTLLDMAGVPCPERVQGRSFAARLRGDIYTPSEAIYTERNSHENFDPVRTVRTERYHYMRNLHPGAKRFLLPNEILNHPNERVRKTWPNRFIWESDLDQPDHPRMSLFEPRPREELYDLQNDPEEFINLADDPGHRKIKERLSALCDRWMEETNDPGMNQPIPAAQTEFLKQHMSRPCEYLQ